MIQKEEFKSKHLNALTRITIVSPDTEKPVFHRGITMKTFCSSKFDEYDNETANIKITIDPVIGCSIEGFTNIHYVDPYDGNEKNEPYDYHYHFDTEEFRVLAEHVKGDYPYYFSDQTAAADSLYAKVAFVIKEEFDFSANTPGGLHKYADSCQIQHTFKMR